MRTAIFTAMLLLAVPALAMAAPLNGPPAPPPVTYDVWGFRWDGQQYVKQATQSLSTTDLKQAVDYAAQLTSYAGWTVTTNMPAASVVHTTYRGPVLSNATPTAFPDKPTFTVWAFKGTDGNWVKDEQYSWTTVDPRQALDYAARINAVPGWTATTNCPAIVPQTERFVDGGTVHGAENYRNFSLQVCDVLYEPRPQPRQSLQPTNIWQQLINLAGQRGNLNSGRWNTTYNSLDNFSNSSSTYDNSAAIQDSINTQNMINMQDMLNTQNFLNTENMVNNLQDMVNTQNMVDTQNMINAMNNP